MQGSQVVVIVVVIAIVIVVSCRTTPALLSCEDNKIMQNTIIIGIILNLNVFENKTAIYYIRVLFMI